MHVSGSGENKVLQNLFRLIDSLNPANVELALKMADADEGLKDALEARYSPLLEHVAYSRPKSTQLPYLIEWVRELDDVYPYCRQHAVAFYASLGEWQMVEKLLLAYPDGMTRIFSVALLNFASQRPDSMQITDIHLDKGDEELHVPLDWASWRGLEGLHVDGPHHARALIPALPQMPNLKYLELQQGDLEYIPTDVMGLVFLEELNLGWNQIQVIPDDITRLSKLRILECNDNQLERIPDHLDSLVDLYKLNLLDNRIVELPASVFAIRKLDILQIQGNQLTKLELPSEVNLPDFSYFSLGNNPWNEFPMEIFRFPRLKYLHIDNCGFDALPPEIGELRALEDLWLSENDFRRLPDEICELVHLKDLYLDFCPLESLPQDIGRLQKLESLSLSESKIEDFPDSFAQLQRLKRLYLANTGVVKGGRVAQKLQLWLPKCELDFDSPWKRKKGNAIE